MKRTLLQFLNVSLLRAAPGLVTLAALLILAGRLPSEEYGIYSTIVATATVLANLVLGPLIYSVLPQHAKWEHEGKSSEYLSRLFGTASALCILVTAIGIIGWLIGLDPTWAGATVCFGLYTLLLEVVRAKLRLWLFGLVSLLQSTMIIVGYTWLVQPDWQSQEIVRVFATSYGIVIPLLWFSCGRPAPRLPTREFARSIWTIGVPYTLSTLFDSLLFVGVRYVLLLGDQRVFLGSFSFCVDIAQRFVGFMVSMAGFMLVPQAYRLAARGNGTSFLLALRRGTAFSLVLASLSTAAVLTIAATGLVPSLSGPPFDAAVFVAVAGAVVINRAKKILLDPLAVHLHRTYLILYGYLIGGPVAIVLAQLAVTMGSSRAVSLAYLAGYAVATAAAAARLVKLSRRLQADDDATASANRAGVLPATHVANSDL